MKINKCLQKNRRKQIRIYKEKTKRLKRVTDIIKHKGFKKSARIEKMLKNSRFAQHLYPFHNPD